MTARSGSESRQRTEQVGVRLTPDERDRLVEAAIVRRIGVSEYLREAALASQQAAADRAVVEAVEALVKTWEAAPKPAHGWDSGLSATEAGERLGAWNTLQRRAAEVRAAIAAANPPADP